MNLSQERFSKMMDQLKLEYEENKPEYAVVAAIPTTFERIIAINEQISKIAVSQASDITGVTKTKAKSKSTLVDHAFEVAAGVYAWAKETKNNTVLEKVHFTRAQLASLNDKKIGPVCKDILNIAAENADGITNYGVDATSLTQFETALADYNKVLPTSRKNVLNRAGDTQKLKTLFAEANEILKETLDKLVVKLKKSNPDRYRSYQAARKLPKQHKKDDPKNPPSPAE